MRMKLVFSLAYLLANAYAYVLVKTSLQWEKNFSLNNLKVHVLKVLVLTRYCSQSFSALWDSLPEKACKTACHFSLC